MHMALHPPCAGMSAQYKRVPNVRAHEADNKAHVKDHVRSVLLADVMLP